MNETEMRQITLRLAETCRDPDAFISKLENSSRGLPSDRGAFFHQVGAILWESHYFDLAIASWNHAAEYAVKDANRRGECASYGNIGTAYRRLGNLGKAIEYHDRSLKVAKLIGNRLLEAQCHNLLGNDYNAAGHSLTAMEHHKESLTISREVRDRSLEAISLSHLGCDYDSMGDYGKAVECHDGALNIAREMSNKHDQAKFLNNLGISLSHLGDFAKAIQHHCESLTIAKEMNDQSLQSQCFGSLGNDYSGLGYSRTAIEFYNESLRITKEIGDKAGEAKTYVNLGTSYGELDQYRMAIEYFNEGLKLAKEIKDLALESACYADIGTAETSLGNSEHAIELLSKSVEMVKYLGLRAAEAKCYVNLANAFNTLGHRGEAIRYTEKSLEIAKEIADKATQSKCYRNLGHSYSSMGDFGRAIEHHEKSLQIAKEIGDRAGEAECYGALAYPHHYLSDSKKAKEYCDRALDIVKETGQIRLARTIYFNLAVIYRENNPSTAYAYCKQSIELSEIIVGYHSEEQHKMTFRAEGYDAHRLMVDLCLTLGREIEAYEYLERGKSRVFLDLLATTEIKPSINPTSEMKSLLDEEASHLARLRSIQIAGLRDCKIRTGLGEIERIRDELNTIYDRIEQLDPEYVSLRRAQPVSLDRIQEILSAQKRDVVLIEYFMTNKQTFIFVLTSKHTGLHLETIPLTQEKLGEYVESYRKEVISHPGSSQAAASWLDLSDYLVRPIAKYLTEGDLIYFIPYGLLHYLPIHALKLEGKPLITHHPVSYSPSASVIMYSQKKKSDKLVSCAAFGVEFEGESENVAELFGTRAFNGKLSTKSSVFENCIDKDIIHFSCHGYFDYLEPLASGINLFDGVLTAKEVFNMKLRCELVTLSACQTGLNKRNPGEELIGLTRAFLYAGSASVIVSLWSVDARSTHELMLKFYTILKAGKDKATALQEAQKLIMATEGYSHPYYWAPFVLIGDWE
jgi:CHAT domain-containing protein/tetratricopeptide (TPR) repeat protein